MNTTKLKDIQRVYVCHTLNQVVLSVIAVYVPAFLLTLHYSLKEVIFYYALAPSVGILATFFIFVPLMRKWGLITLFKLYYPLQIAQLALLFSLQFHKSSLILPATFYGIANYAYWIPVNLLFVRHSDNHEMGSNVAKFYALPQLFGIIGPLVGAFLIPFFGFWPVFILTMLALLFTYIPLAKVNNTELTISLHFRSAWQRLKKNKILFLFEGFDNVLEESDWFWGIYVYLLIGSLTTPGITGSLSAIGGSFFTLVVGKYANRHDKKLIPIAAVLLLIVNILRMTVATPLSAYVLTLFASFIFTLFLVVYFSTIYRTIKGKGEEEFILLREIPVVLGRMVVFGMIYVMITHLKYFFITPIVFIVFLVLMYYWKRHVLAQQAE